MKTLCRLWALLAAAYFLAGCASQPLVMRLEASPEAAGRVFPPPETQEVPRYRYLGQLVGESNFQSANGDRRGTARKLIALITGLDDAPEQPVVLQRPHSGAVDGSGRILVTDVSRNAVFVFDEAAGRLDLWEAATPTERFVAPVGITAGRNGEVLVSDAELGRVFRLGADGKPRGEFGAGVLQRPAGLARDPGGGRVFVADTRAHDVKVFDDDGNLLETWGRRGEAPGEFNFPTHLTFVNGAVVVVDTMNARVQVLGRDGRPTLGFGQRGRYVGNLARPKGVAADDEGNLYVVESMYDTLLVFDRAGQFLMPLDSAGGAGERFYLPAGVWTDSRNRVFVADMFNGRVAIFQFLGGG